MCMLGVSSSSSSSSSSSRSSQMQVQATGQTPPLGSVTGPGSTRRPAQALQHLSGHEAGAPAPAALAGGVGSLSALEQAEQGRALVGEAAAHQRVLPPLRCRCCRWCCCWWCCCCCCWWCCCCFCCWWCCCCCWWWWWWCCCWWWWWWWWWWCCWAPDAGCWAQQPHSWRAGGGGDSSSSGARVTGSGRRWAGTRASERSAAAAVATAAAGAAAGWGCEARPTQPQAQPQQAGRGKGCRSGRARTHTRQAAASWAVGEADASTIAPAAAAGAPAAPPNKASRRQQRASGTRARGPEAGVAAAPVTPQQDTQHQRGAEEGGAPLPFVQPPAAAEQQEDNQKQEQQKQQKQDKQPAAPAAPPAAARPKTKPPQHAAPPAAPHTPAKGAAPAAQQEGGAGPPHLPPRAGCLPSPCKQQAVQDPASLFDALLAASRCAEAASSGLNALLVCNYVALWDTLSKKDQGDKVRGGAWLIGGQGLLLGLLLLSGLVCSCSGSSVASEASHQPARTQANRLHTLLRLKEYGAAAGFMSMAVRLAEVRLRSGQGALQ